MLFIELFFLDYNLLHIKAGEDGHGGEGDCTSATSTAVACKA